MKEDHIHAVFKCPTIGLLKKETSEALVLSELKEKVWTQLRDMTLGQFKKYCRIERRGPPYVGQDPKD